jgi:hypothetical protein
VLIIRSGFCYFGGDVKNYTKVQYKPAIIKRIISYFGKYTKTRSIASASCGEVSGLSPRIVSNVFRIYQLINET